MTIKDARNLFRLKKEFKGIKDTVLRNISSLKKKKKTINFIYSKDDNDEGGAMHSKSASIEIMITDEVDEIKLFLCLIAVTKTSNQINKSTNKNQTSHHQSAK